MAHDLRKARDAGLMTSYEPELRELEIKDAEAVAARTATENAQQAEGLMQQVRALDRMPKENHDPKECRLASPLLFPRRTWGRVPPVILGMRPGGMNVPDGSRHVWRGTFPKKLKLSGKLPEKR